MIGEISLEKTLVMVMSFPRRREPILGVASRIGSRLRENDRIKARNFFGEIETGEKEKSPRKTRTF